MGNTALREPTKEMRKVSQIMTRRFHFEEWVLSGKYSQFEKRLSKFLFIVEAIQENDEITFTASIEPDDKDNICVEYTFVIPISKIDKLQKHWITFKHSFINLANQADRFAKNSPFENK